MAFDKKHGVMLPDIKDPYTYLKIMEQDGSETIRLIAKDASDILNSNKELDSETNKIRSFEFLKKVAEKQRQNEQRFLEAKIKEIESLGNGELQKTLKEALEKCKSNFDYITFTKILNNALTTISQFQARVKAIKRGGTGLDEEEKLLNELDSKLIPNLAQTRENFYYGKNEFIRQLTLSFLQKYGQDFIMSSKDPLDIAAGTILIQQELARFLSDNDIFKKEEKSILNCKEDFIRIFQELEDKTLKRFYEETKISHMFYDQTLLNEIKQLVGLEYEKIIPDTKKSNPSKVFNAVMTKFKNDPFFDYPEITEQLAHIRVKWNGKNKTSALEEIKLLLSQRGIQLGQLNSATDTIGFLEADSPNIEKLYKTEKEPITLKALKDLRATLIQEKAANDPKKTSEIYQKKLAELDKKLTNITKSFIIHDTVKLYRTLEKDKSDFSTYTGRKMNIFNYIDSMAQMGQYFGANTDWLKFAAYNLSQDALGSFNKAPLETIFTVVAGLIMFDDFSIMAKEITENLEYTNITNIHLYQLQGIYVPASYILSETYDRLNYQLTHEGPPKDNGISATISAPSIKYEDKNDSKVEDWKQIKQKVYSNTKVTLHFAAAFIDFVSKLFEN